MYAFTQAKIVFNFSSLTNAGLADELIQPALGSSIKIVPWSASVSIYRSWTTLSLSNTTRGILADQSKVLIIRYPQTLLETTFGAE